DLSNLSASAAEGASETLLTTNITNFTGFIFENCTALTTVNYPKSIAAIPNNIFKGCSSLNNFNFNDLTNLTSIGTAAFQNSGLSGTIDLTSCTKLTSIPGYFISGTEVNEVKVPNTITSISESAFMDATSLNTLDLTNITSNNLNLGRNSLRNTGLTEVDTVAATGNGSSQTGLLLPTNKEIILAGNDQFSNMPNLTSVKLESTSETNNGNTNPLGVFTNSSKLKTIDLSKFKAVQYIVNGNSNNKGTYSCFKGLPNITEMKVVNVDNKVSATDGQLLLPNTLTSYSQYAFQGMTGLTKVDLNAATNLTTINANAFAQSPITELTLPTSTTVSVGGVDINLTPVSQLVINGVIGGALQISG
ncbi:MAG: leucine-rich repeat domain-containing protein, partial [Ureaplasma sp.]|nr:leucine-rich repeat domain-containing protein [Ureaplasma sp.]